MIFNKYLQYSLSILIMFCLSSCGSSKKINKLIDKATNEDTNQLLLEFDFQKDFKEDTILLKINNELIFNNVILNSIDLLDFTQFKVYVIGSAHGNALVVYHGKKSNDGSDFYGKTRIKEMGNSAQVVCEVNGHQSIKVVEIGNGKFVGINKIINDSVAFTQRKTSFQYD